MSTSIDNRIVRLEFDNKDFEKEIQVSLKSLEALKEGLDLDQAVKHLSNLDEKLSAFSLDNVAKAIDSVTEKFSFFGTMTSRIVEKITDDIYGLGKKITKELTIDNVEKGFTKYEQQTKAVQSLTATTGKTVHEITPYIEELMKYSDDTSYSFNDMLDSVAKFVNNGIEIGQAVKAVKGIANEAASAGMGINEASRAMYNFSQALATGSVKKIDWKSIENANMATAEFKQAIIDSAVELGVLSKKGDKVFAKVGKKGKAMEITAENFAETLSSGWFNNDVLMDVLLRYENVADILGEKAFRMAKETKTFTEMFEYLKDAISSGWMQSFKYIFGDYDEAVEMWSTAADTLGVLFGDIAEQRNELLKTWHDEGGREKLLETVKYLWEGLTTIGNAIKEAWQTIFPPMTVETMHAYTRVLWRFGKQFAEAFSEDTEEGRARLEAIKNAVVGVASMIKLLIRVVNPLVRGFLKIATTVVDHVLVAFGKLGLYLKELGESETFAQFCDTLVAGFDTIKNVVKQTFPIIIDGLVSFVDNFITFLNENGIIAKGMEVFKQLFGLLLFVIPAAVMAIGELTSSLIGFLKANPTVQKYVESIISFFTAIGHKIKEFSEVFGSALKESFEMDTSNEKTLIDKIKKRLEPFAKVGEWVSEQMELFREKMYETFPILETIDATLKPFTSKLSEFGSVVAEAFSEVINMDTSNIEGFWAKLQKRLEPLSKISDWIGAQLEETKNKLYEKYPILQTIDDMIRPFMETMGEFLTIISTAISEAINVDTSDETTLLGKIKKRLEPFDAVAKWLGEKFTDLKNKIYEKIPFIKTIADGVSALFEKLSSLKTNFSFDNIKQIFSDIWESIKEFVAGNKEKAVEGINNAIGGLTEGFKKIGEFGSSIKDSIVGKIANTIRNLVNFIVDLFSGENATKLVTAAKNIASVFLIFAKMKFLGDLGKTLKQGITLFDFSSYKNMKSGNFTDSILKIAASIALVAGALLIISKIDNKSLKKALGTLALISVALIAVTAVLRLVQGGSDSFMKDFGIGLLATAGAVAILYLTLKNIAKQDPAAFISGLLGLGAILLELAIFSRLVAPKDLVKTGLGILAIAFAIGLLNGTIAKLGKMDSGVLTQGLVALGAILVELGLFSRLAGNSINIKTGISFLLMSVALSNMMVPLTVLAKMKTDELKQGLIALGVLLLELGAFAKLGGKDLTTASASLIIAAIGLGFIAQAIKQFAGFATDDLVKAIGSITAIILGICALFLVFKSQSVMGVVGVAAKIVLFAVTFGAAAAALGALFETFPQLQGLIEKGGEAFFAIGEALGKLIGGLIEGIFGRVSITQFGKDLEKLGTSLQTFGYKVSNLDKQTISAAALCIAELGGATHKIPATGGIIQWLAGEVNITKFAEDIVALGAGLANFSTLVSGRVDLDTVSAASACLETLVALSKDIPTTGGIFGFFKRMAFGSTDYAKLYADFTGLGNALIAFGDTINGKIDIATVQSAAIVLDILVPLTKEIPTTGGLINKLKEGLFGYTDYEQFGRDLSSLGSGIASFSDSVSGVDTDAVERSRRACEIIIELTTGIPRDGGVLQAFIGSIDAETFGSKLPALGTGLKAFSDNIQGLDSETITNSKTAIEIIISLVKGIPRNGGFLDAFIGSINADQFGAKLPALGKGIKSFSDNIQGIDTKTIESAKSAMSIVVNLAKGIPRDGGFLQAFIGSIDAAAFGSKLPELGKGVKGFSDAVTGVDASLVGEVGTATTVLTDLANNLPETGGRLQEWFGEKESLSDFGSQISSLGDGLSYFASKTSGINPEGLQGPMSLLGDLLDAGDRMFAYDAVTRYSSFTEALGVLGEQTYIFASKMSGLPGIFEAQSALRLLDAVGRLAVEYGNQKGADKGVRNLTKAVKELGKDQEFLNAFTELTSGFISGLNKGLKEGEGAAGGLNDTIRELGSGMASAIDAYKDEAYVAGQNFALGYARGIAEHTATAVATAGALGDSASRNLKDKLDEHSPSRITYEIGKFFDMGLANGIDDWTSVAIAASSGLAKDSIDAFNKHADEFKPYYRPIVDLSGIQYGANAMGAMLDTSSMGLNAHTSSTYAEELMANVSYSDRVQIIDAIGAINNKLGQLGEAITKMQVVMDSGTLVGELVAPMDNALGQRTIFRGRG